MTIDYLAKEYNKLMEKQAREIEISRQKVLRKYKPKLDKLKRVARELSKLGD